MLFIRTKLWPGYRRADVRCCARDWIWKLDWDPVGSSATLCELDLVVGLLFIWLPIVWTGLGFPMVQSFLVKFIIGFKVPTQRFGVFATVQLHPPHRPLFFKKSKRDVQKATPSQVVLLSMAEAQKESLQLGFCVKGQKKSTENICGQGSHNLPRKLLWRKPRTEGSFSPESHWNHLLANTIRHRWQNHALFTATCQAEQRTPGRGSWTIVWPHLQVACDWLKIFKKTCSFAGEWKWCFS